MRQLGELRLQSVPRPQVRVVEGFTCARRLEQPDRLIEILVSEPVRRRPGSMAQDRCENDGGELMHVRIIDDTPVDGVAINGYSACATGASHPGISASKRAFAARTSSAVIHFNATF